ncbi:2-phospho-L-lactate transferase [Halioglobus japonicus]|uniref:2-phospho-L-lactate transferase n=1 Tax=Halioglobus japonicus TaxID=930805 RepID=A0AAP8SNH5_9GAMM|nr:2-phospho-L-lactate transferase [Halioglobus japonicus]AQA18461.1 2-phospho-L-lactate transferase [Halioglobus japonicus]PLW86476.1 2-phospho-L-lactate transferase [Halioglobus japonicus]GHD12633.1 LPPG--FO 2-phospho-L-lactate transferase [Halioglobus japonicus]
MAEPVSKTLALSGGVGGAKLCLGLASELAGPDLDILVNTGDDFEHLGLPIWPDIDTLLYTLSGRANQVQGWGIEGETWNFMEALETLGGETWFRLGDRDLATHTWRSQALREGRHASDIVASLASTMGIEAAVYPMSDDPVRTQVHSDEGDLPFQHYFVRRQCEPEVTGFSFEGITSARPNQTVLRTLQQGGYRRVVICPSNPYVSIDPILQVPGVWTALRDAVAPVIVVSPIVAGLAIKGPAAKMMSELAVPVTALGVAEHYQRRYPGLVDYFVIDESDATLAPEIEALGIRVEIAPTIMKDLQHKMTLARHCLALEAM